MTVEPSGAADRAPPTREHRGWTSAFLATASGLALLGAATAEWTVATVEREVSGVVVPERVATTGAELEPALLVVGLVVLVTAVPLAVTRGRLRRGVAVVVAAAGVAAAVLSVRATLQAGDLPGQVQPVVGLAYLAATGAVATGAVGGGRARRPARRHQGQDQVQPGQGQVHPGQSAGPRQPASATQPPPPPSRPERRPTSAPADEWALAVDDEDA